MSNFEFDAKPCQAYQPNTSTINNNSYCHQQHYRVHHRHHYPQQLQNSPSRQYQETLNTTIHNHNITPTTALPSIQQFNSECYTNNQSTSPIVNTVSTDSSYIDPTLGGYLINNQPYKNLKQQQQQNLKMLTLSRSNTGSNNANSFSSCNNDYNNNNDNNYNLSELKYNNNNNRNSYYSNHHQLINNTVTNNRSTGALSHSQRQHPQRPNTLNLTTTTPLTSLPKYFNTPLCTSNIVATSTTTCPTLPSSSFCLGKPEILQNNFNNYALLHNNGSNNNNLINYDHNHNNGNNCDNNLNDQSVNYTVEQQQYFHNSQNQHQQQEHQHQPIQHLQCLGQQLKQHQNSATAYDAAGNVTITATTANNLYTVASCSTNDGTDNAKNNSDKLTLDACEIANFLANELFMQQLVSMECMQTGVPTLTTPTLTPTTLRSIEESFIQLTSEPLNVPYQAGFIPPPLGSYNTSSNNNVNNNNNNATTSANILTTNANLNNVYLGDLSGGTSLHEYGNLNDSETENSQGSWNPAQLNEENSLATTDTSSAATDSTSFQNGLNNVGINALNNSNSLTANNDFTKANIAALAAATSANTKMPNTSNTSNSATHTATPTRRGGGRRPAASTNMTPEEEEKRRIRRERNKLAAARCRKRRVDQTNELTEEVALLEKKREDLQKQIERLNSDKQELEYILKAHTCKKIHQDLLTVNSYAGLGANEPITGLDTSLASTARSISPMDLKPVLNDELLTQIKPEPLDSTLDSNSSLDQDGPPSPKRLLFDNPMVPPPLPNVATLSASLAAASASLNAPIVTTAPVNFGLMIGGNCTLNPPQSRPNSKQRPNSLPTVPRSMAQSLALNVNKPPTDINGVAIQTPSTGMFNFDSLMDGGTGLTPVSGPLVPNCSSQNKHPLELVTPTSEPSKILSL